MSAQKTVETIVQHDLSEDSEQFLTFFLDDEEYGVDILRVQEIRGWESTTPLPNSPDYLKGVINLRGTIVPIFDLRQKFGMETIDYSKRTVVVILRVSGVEKDRVMGVVVDAVSDVYNITTEQCKHPPDVGSNSNVRAVEGLATVGEKMVIILNIDRLLGEGNLPSEGMF